MKNGRYSDAQIMTVLKQAEGDAPIRANRSCTAVPVGPEVQIKTVGHMFSVQRRAAASTKLKDAAALTNVHFGKNGSCT